MQYKLTEDRALDFHYDDSHVTLNVCLGRQFEGGDLYFKGMASHTAGGTFADLLRGRQGC